MTIREQYLSAHPTPRHAVLAFCADVMRSNPDTFKVGYSAENALIAAREQFGDVLTDEQWDELSGYLLSR